MKRFLLAAVVLMTLAPAQQAYAQATQSTSNSSTGTTNRLSVTISNTNGVSSSATMTPNFDVYTSAKLIVGPDSTSFQEISDPTAALNNTGNTPGSTSSSASGVAQGASSIGNIKYGDGTAYEVRITPKDNEGQPRDAYSTAQGSASGNVTTQIVIDSTSSSFVNAFFSSF
jgi:hypothetical protein